MAKYQDGNAVSLRVFWLAVAGVFAAWGLVWVFMLPLEGRGTIGDMFGVVNALFSGLAFTGIIYTVLLQSRELQLQRRELSLTRVELEGQKLQLAAQNETLRRESFEHTFFALLRLQNDILAAMDLRGPEGQSVRGRDCFRQFCGRFRVCYTEYADQHPRSMESERINAAYLRFFDENQAELEHYFRSLYNTVKFVKISDVKEKRFYTNLIRSQLSSYEVVLLFYSCLSDFGRDRFKPLIEEFALLEALPRALLINSTEHLLLYEAGAFG
ncbi:MAG: putative phage abortive infection protein [Gammaproteobacteria bacterium]|nr:putative phage abortive infection protein [Gammaproteobacteria bacterium]